jgi:hypothetical protein
MSPLGIILVVILIIFLPVDSAGASAATDTASVRGVGLPGTSTVIVVVLLLTGRLRRMHDRESISQRLDRPGDGETPSAGGDTGQRHPSVIKRSGQQSSRVGEPGRPSLDPN